MKAPVAPVPTTSTSTLRSRSPESGPAPVRVSVITPAGIPIVSPDAALATASRSEQSSSAHVPSNESANVSTTMSAGGGA